MSSALVAAVFAAALGVGAPPALAVLVHLRSGKVVSYQPLRHAAAAPNRFDDILTNLDYSGGPVMPSNTNYTVYWDPAGGASYPGDYMPGVNQYLTDLAHDIGGHANVDSAATQYNDASGSSASYNSHFAGALIDTDPYPADGCPGAPSGGDCLTDAQIQAELDQFLSNHGLPRDLTHEYFLLTPPRVESCFDAAGAQGCSAGNTFNPTYCAYHSFSSTAAGFVYANDPYVTGLGGCDDGNHPNGTTSDGALQGGLSHEHNESTTDPQPNNAWTDYGASAQITGSENGDKCGNGPSPQFGAPLGTAPNGATYNQKINGHDYWYQEEWSNKGSTCLQRFPANTTTATAQFTAAPVSGNTVSFDATGSTASGGVKEYVWQFNDCVDPVTCAGAPQNNTFEKPTATTTHTFPSAGTYTVALTVMANDGTSRGTAHQVIVSDESPVAAFSVPTSFPTAGQPVSFDASASHDDSDGTITTSWNWGDGSPAGSGLTPTHTYALPGSYGVTLIVHDSAGMTASQTYTVNVDETPTAAFAVTTTSPAPGQAVSFDASASNDPDGAITTTSWDWGDGTATGSGASPTHAFAMAGTYNITLTVVDRFNRTASVSQPLTVAFAPPPPPPPSPPPPLPPPPPPAHGITSAVAQAAATAADAALATALRHMRLGRLVKVGSVVVKLVAPGAGVWRIVVTAKGPNHTSIVVLQGSRNVGAGASRIRAHMTKAGKKVARKASKLTLKTTVSFTATNGANGRHTSTVTLKR